MTTPTRITCTCEKDGNPFDCPTHGGKEPRSDGEIDRVLLDGLLEGINRIETRLSYRNCVSTQLGSALTLAEDEIASLRTRIIELEKENMERVLGATEIKIANENARLTARLDQVTRERDEAVKLLNGLIADIEQLAGKQSK